jgi:hypothetical protein
MYEDHELRKLVNDPAFQVAVDFGGHFFRALIAASARGAGPARSTRPSNGFRPKSRCSTPTRNMPQRSRTKSHRSTVCQAICWGTVSGGLRIPISMF